jgi:hypothetical protein
MTLIRKGGKRVILPFEDFASFPTIGNTENFYFDEETGKMYYWNGTEYVSVGNASTPLHQFETATTTASQTAFTLSKTPVLGTSGKVRVSRNGIDITRAFTWVGANGTYNPADNYGCVIDENDNLQFEFESL